MAVTVSFCQVRQWEKVQGVNIPQFPFTQLRGRPSGHTAAGLDERAWMSGVGGVFVNQGEDFFSAQQFQRKLGYQHTQEIVVVVLSVVAAQNRAAARAARESERAPQRRKKNIELLRQRGIVAIHSDFSCVLRLLGKKLKITVGKNVALSKGRIGRIARIA